MKSVKTYRTWQVGKSGRLSIGKVLGKVEKDNKMGSRRKIFAGICGNRLITCSGYVNIEVVKKI